jgi:hypothetical protein
VVEKSNVVLFTGTREGGISSIQIVEGIYDKAERGSLFSA